MASSSSTVPSLCENHIISASSSAAVDDSFEDACSICLEPFSTANPATVTSCKHEYHLQCILEWSQRSKECPICWQLFVLQDPASQELLAAVESERCPKSRNITSSVPSPFHQEFDFGLDPTYTDYPEIEERVMQHLATARYFRRRELQRAAGLDHSQVLVFTSAANAPGMLSSNTTSPDSSCSSSEGDTATSSIQSAASIQHSSFLSGAAVTRDGPFRPRVIFRKPQPDSPRGSNPTEILSLSDSIKSKWSAASARYKESISKSTRGLKERLLARNNSVKELSKEVQREMSAGIAGVAKMIERLDLASKRTGNSVPTSGCTVGTSSVLFKGKGVQESAINKKSGEVSPDNGSDVPPPVTGGTNPGQLEVMHAQRL
ncbi:E3 ubiquitin-protein ligase RHF1A-like [Mangifera indica]|uniref:E3 ubiquitin-protein ligase RHF1A-like n=1 Tax=Mangifera indica TaxID=29780 RepID=UPI001CF9EFC9|nr:E3 ubiquitin-protein ligase RHF1A-like [Mangifera indica]